MKERTLGTTCAQVRTAVAVVSLIAATAVHAEVTSAQLKEVYGPDLIILGEVQGVDASRGVVLVSGQHVAVGADTIYVAEGSTSSESATGIGLLHRGDMVAVF